MTLYYGCPVWAHRGWVGNVFPPEAKPQDYLRHYAEVFNAVEANSTFYALPKAEIVQRWAADVPKTFRFCFKMPRAISHDSRLVGAEAETQRLFERLQPLGEQLGPFFLQLPPSFDGRGLSVLKAYLQSLPGDFSYAVELRHPDWFDEGPHEARLHDLLRTMNIERVLFDSRPLFASAPADATTAAAQAKKPRVPVRRKPVLSRPFVRFVASNDPRASSGFLGQWPDEVARCLDAGQDAYFFTHAPDETFAPRHARVFLHLMHRLRPDRVPPMPPWPGEAPVKKAQLSLLGNEPEQ